ncbi:MAG TPA: glycosyltransferase [Nitrosomonas halophila]|nr:glycosyltransferase [Nitrosomonas halophila]
MQKSLVHYHIDHAVRQGNLVFGHGWLFHESAETIQLQLRSGDFSIPLEFGNPRSDVVRAYPATPLAEPSGFLFYVRLPVSHAKLTSPVRLVAEFADGEQLDIPLAFPALTSKRWPLIYTVVRRLWVLLKQGDFSAIREKSRRYLKSWALSSSDSRQLVKQLQHKPCVIIVDHSLGGGTNLYRAQRIDCFHSQAREVLVVTYHPALLGYRIEHHARHQAVRHYQLDRLETILALASGLSVETILYNNAVSFPDAAALPAILVALARLTSARLELALHDYFLFCPSPHLLDAQGHFCDLPKELALCQRCLAHSTQSFVPIYGIHDIGSWRSQWRELIVTASAIQVFSKGMATLLAETFPDLNPAAVMYTPHSMAYFADAMPLQPPAAPLRIGVVGNITPIKGSAVVANLARVIQGSGRDDIELIVIGTLHASSKTTIRQTGAYRHQDLPEILSREKINLVLFPSIGPETFSYVIQEMKILGLPIVAFNLGAQAEYLRQYPKSLLLTLDISPEDLFIRIIEFHQKIYPNQA